MSHSTAPPLPGPGDAAAKSARATRSYLLHGLTLSVTAEPEILAALHARLGRFPEGHQPGAPQLQFEFGSAFDTHEQLLPRPAGPGRTVMELTAGTVDYFAESQQLFVDLAAAGRRWPTPRPAG
jgi:hypothetical protein